ncbi:MAG: hypothetical protein R3346_04380 [Candidatus Spechtbacterales bacterium]|nr:hypothetical protein [Candidatus Spechtbacterales bacterium]
MEFEHTEDREFFIKLLANGDEKEFEKRFKDYFDFRDPSTKRKEFNSLRNKILSQLTNEYGSRCQLQLNDNCKLDQGLVVDHLIPLSTNKLNKNLRNLKPEKGKKVKAQSLGSNNLKNLVIACDACNNYKKHKILNKKDIQRILENK